MISALALASSVSPASPASNASLDQISPAAFFRALYGTIPAGSKFELRAKSPDKKATAHSAWFSSWDEFDEFALDGFGAGENIWYSAAYRLAQATRATLTDLSIAPLVWLDADKLDPEKKDRLQRDLRAFSCPPTAIISSSDGGLQAVWRLASSLDMQDPEDVTRLREIVYGLAVHFGSDATVHNPDRVLRVPSTLNYGNGRTKVYSPPQMARLLFFDSERRCPVESFDQIRQPVPRSESAMVEIPADLPPAPEPKNLKVSRRWRDRILKGHTPGCGYQSRSELDLAAAIALLRAGHSLDEVTAIFLHPDYAISGKASESGLGYLSRTLAKAKACLEDGRDHGHYRATDTGLIWDRPGGGPVQLTNFAAQITGETIEDDGVETRKTLNIEARLGTRTSRFAVSPEEFTGMVWPIECLNAKAIVFPGPSTRDHARAAIQSLSDKIEARRVFTHTGWRQLDGAWTYLHGEGAIGKDGAHSDVLVKLPPPLVPFVLPVPTETPETIREAVRASLRMLDVAPDAITIPLLAAAYRAVLGDTDFAMHLVGRSGLGKTELAALVQQHFGAGFDARHLPGTWASTANSIERLCFTLKDGVIVVDDFAPGGSPADVQRMHREAARLIRAQGNRAGRGRLTADAQQRVVTPPRGMLLSTGEDTPRDQSIRARILVLELAAEVNWAALTRAQADAAQGLYAQAMASFIRWVAGRHEEISRTKCVEIARLRAASREGQHRRSIDILANLTWGLGVFVDFAVSAGAMSEEEASALRSHASAALAHSTSVQMWGQREADLAHRYVSLLKAALTAGWAHVVDASGNKISLAGQPPDSESYGGRGTRIGWRVEDGIYIDPVIAFTVVQRVARDSGEHLPVNEPALRRRLKDCGLLASTDVDTPRQTITVRRQFEGVRQNVLHFAATTLEGDDR